jgi:16S rRNA (guanine527-N7)-methyltransferase
MPPDPPPAITFSLDAAGSAAARPPSVATWLDLLAQWNRRIDLTAARSDDELHDLMLADAALLATASRNGELLVPTGARVVDVGSGAGAPGLALALLRPDLGMTLVEPLTKRAAFLRTVLGSLGRTDIQLVPKRGEEVLATSPSYDVAISRATLPPPAWVPLGLGLARVAWTLLAKEEPPVLPGATLDLDVAYTWPATGAARRAVRYVRP